jgi:hypothetical protein
MKSVARWIILRAIMPALDSAILWAFGWRKEWVAGMDCGPHYVDPRDPDHLLLRDTAVDVACARAQWKSTESARKSAARRKAGR